ncbi:hypothetical protein [Hoyosella subflava]|uniref:SH3 type 3 domain protein n=1 Tax=Hoyosella subflava (strain DSM 45089 / JCM 17490 / NBRC 109087 / DQS3-9A1) TaxID=443218 RepID=F6EF00_HOYSD|nr:hypothetical protein [Hoyosella subflava]AEF42137.1 SH3 type 3 domain protein [Hoyosella subflava DQS3-9A1]
MASTNVAVAEAPAPMSSERATVGILALEAAQTFVPRTIAPPVLPEVLPPPPPPPSPVDIALRECPFGSAESLGLTANAAMVYRAVCALFPQVTAFGGLRPGDGGDHGHGRAVDFMISSDVGDAIADYALAHAGQFGVSYVIWRQRIRYPGGEWQQMEDRGSATENHFDHVHVSFH